MLTQHPNSDLQQNNQTVEWFVCAVNMICISPKTTMRKSYDLLINLELEMVVRGQPQLWQSLFYLDARHIAST